MGNAELRTRVCGDYAVVVLCGELDTTDAEAAAGAVTALAVDGKHLIIDLETLDFIDCHATGALLRVRKSTRQSGGDVLLAAPHGSVLRLLSLLGVPGVYASVAAAADSAGRRDGRWGAVSIPRPGRAMLSGARMVARKAAAGDRSWSPRWLRARSGLRG
ncbi:MAG: STAS domain-containing protein [Streptosporangiaceae bacterium]